MIFFQQDWIQKADLARLQQSNYGIVEVEVPELDEKGLFEYKCACNKPGSNFGDGVISCNSPIDNSVQKQILEAALNAFLVNDLTILLDSGERLTGRRIVFDDRYKYTKNENPLSLFLFFCQRQCNVQINYVEMIDFMHEKRKTQRGNYIRLPICLNDSHLLKKGNDKTVTSRLLRKDNADFFKLLSQNLKIENPDETAFGKNFSYWTKEIDRLLNQQYAFEKHTARFMKCRFKSRLDDVSGLFVLTNCAICQINQKFMFDYAEYNVVVDYD